VKGYTEKRKARHTQTAERAQEILKIRHEVTRDNRKCRGTAFI